MSSIAPRQKCTHCGYMVIAGQMPAHLAQTHPLLRTPPLTPSPTVRSGGTKTPLRQLVACPLCQSMYRHDYLGTHMARDHQTKGGIKPPVAESPHRPGSNCQSCGVYLAKRCYSKSRTNGRVPRTNKICGKCFKQLDSSDQVNYFSYTYKKNSVHITPKGFSQ